MSEAISGNTPRNLDKHVDLLLRDVELAPDFDPSSLQWDESLAGLVQPQEDGLKRVVMYRAFTPSGARELSVQQLANKSEAETAVGNSVHGVGIYTGNSIESVSRFAWEKGRELGVFLSPPVSDEEIKSLLAPKDNLATKARGIGAMATRTLSAKRDKQGYLERFKELYGNSKLVVMDKPIDMRLAQRTVGKMFRYPVRPAWYLWRDGQGTFTQIGAATKRVNMGNLRHKALSIRYKDRFVK